MCWLPEVKANVPAALGTAGFLLSTPSIACGVKVPADHTGVIALATERARATEDFMIATILTDFLEYYKKETSN